MWTANDFLSSMQVLLSGGKSMSLTQWHTPLPMASRAMHTFYSGGALHQFNQLHSHMKQFCETI